MSSKLFRGGITDLPRYTWSRPAGMEPHMPAPAPEPPPPPPVEPPSESQIDEIREMLSREFEERLQKERARVFESARESAYSQAQQELQPQLERMVRSIDELSKCRDRYRRETERELVQLSIEIARRILRRELSVDSNAVLGLLHSAIESVSMRELLEIRVHPSHADVIRNRMQQLGAPETVQIIGDGHLEPGSVLVETRRGGFDASVNTQLDEIQRGFTDLMTSSTGKE